MPRENERDQYDNPRDFGSDSLAEFKNLLRDALLTLLPIIVILFLIHSCFVYVKPNEFGIKQVNIGFKSGIHKTIYQTGLHFLMPLGMEVMHRFPRDMQVLELTSYTESA